MPDILMSVLHGANKRLKDMGDGTVAEVVYTANAGGGGAGGSVTVTNFPAAQAVTDVNLGVQADAPASADAGSFSLISLVKRLLAKMPSLGPQTMANASAVTIASDQTVPVALLPVSASGALGALNAAVTLLPGGASGAVIDLRGTFVATIAFQGTVDGANWFALGAVPVGAGANATPVSTTTAPGAWFVLCAGLAQIRVLASAYTSGSATATLRATQAAPVLYTAPTGATSAVALATGANLAGDLGMQYRPSVAGAASVTAILSPVTPVGAVAKASAGRLIGLQLQNSASTVRSLKLFNTASVTPGTSAALFEIDVPAGGAVTLGFEGGIAFSVAIAWMVTAAKGLSDATATGLVANDLSGVLVFA